MEDIKQIERLGSESINKLLLEFSWPAMIGYVTIALYELTDRIFVGQTTGSDGLAVMAIGMPVIITINALCIMFRAGVSSLLSRTLGSGNYNAANKFITEILFFTFTVGIFLTGVIGYFASDIAKICASPEELLSQTDKYITIIAIGSAGLFVGNAASVIIRTLGHPQQSMLLIVGSAVLNIILDAIFVIYMDYGLIGAALGTILSQTAGGIYGIYYLRKRISFRQFNFNLSTAKKCTLLGAPLAFFEINYMFSVLVLNNQLSIYGTNVDLASLPIFTSILSLLFMPIAGLDEGAQILIGYNYAADKKKRVRKIIINVLGIGICFYTLSFIVLQSATQYVVMIFTTGNPEFISHVSHICRIIFAVAPIMAFMHIIPGILTALGDIRYNFSLSVILEILGQYPLLFILPLFWGIDGIFISFPIFDIIFAVAASFLLYKSIKQKKI